MTDFSPEDFVAVPHRELSAAALRGLIEEFVTRDGTEYGDYETSLETRVNQVRRQLDRGECVILFEIGSETCTIVRREQVPAALLR